MSNYNDYGRNFYSSNTNLVFVTSLEEALIRTNGPNADMVYFHQNDNLFYRVKVDGYGQKTWAEFSYDVPSAKSSVDFTKEDFKLLEDRIAKLESRFKEVDDLESDK